jgi:DNA repair protein RadC
MRAESAGPFASTGPAGHRARMRARLAERGGAALADHEVLEMLLFLGIPRGDVKPLAKATINRFGSLAAALGAEPERLAALPGWAPRAAQAIGLVQRAAERVARAEAEERPVLNSGERLAAYLDAAPGEGWRGLFLDNRNRLVADESLPGAAEALARATLRRALDLHATALIAVHVRDGEAWPEPDEIAAARSLRAGGALLSVVLHDVLIGRAPGFASLRREGLLAALG